MTDRFSFSFNGHGYDVDNTAYPDAHRKGVYFEVKKCSKCRHINHVGSKTCEKCNSLLPADSVCIASHVKRSGRGVLIGTGIWGVINMILGMLARIRLGGILTLIILGGCLYLGDILAGTRIEINNLATMEYKSFMEKQLERTRKVITDPELIKEFSLTKVCPTCHNKTEADSGYCSFCGRSMKLI